jgi:hypothetical protein
MEFDRNKGTNLNQHYTVRRFDHFPALWFEVVDRIRHYKILWHTNAFYVFWIDY